jgi:hypothetical protein
MNIPSPRAVTEVTSKPRKKSKNHKVVLAARVSEAEFYALKGLAARHRVTMTDLLRQWLRTLDMYRPASLKRSHRRE